MLGVLLQETARHRDAVGPLQRAVELIGLGPGAAEARYNLATALGSLGRYGEAADRLKESLRLRPDFPAAWQYLGIALAGSGRPDQAAGAHRRAIQLRPDYPEAHNHLGDALRALGRLGEAENEHREAIRLKPDYPPAYNSLAATLSLLGRAEEVVACFRKLVELRPQSPVTGSDLLAVLHNVDGVAPQEMFQEHVRWAERHARPLYKTAAPRGAADSDRDPNRRLRVGYVSPDFREYPAARFFEPLLAGHDREKVEVFCYSDVTRPDAVTARLRAYGCTWRDIGGLPDERVEQMVREDRIDILVDLAGHMSNPRLLLFARRPAPVQVSYLGYPDTTGLPTIDYRITDEWHDPPGMSEAYHTEELVRLPRCCWSYGPGKDLPTVGALAADSSGVFTFGIMSRLVKVTPRMMGLWARILTAVPSSRLMVLVARGVETEPSVRERFTAAGVGADRLAFLAHRPRREYLELFGQVDLALDTFPYCGMTTTSDALWMGVPTVTLSGQTHVSRTGVSILHAVGLAELVAQTADEYVDIAVALARDVPRLRELRAGMRERVRASDLSNGTGLAAAIETAFRQMWAVRH